MCTLEGECTKFVDKGIECTKCVDYRIYSNKRRGAYLIFRVSCAALIRGRRLFEGSAY